MTVTSAGTRAAGPGALVCATIPADRHLFTDSSLPSYDAAATALVVQRSREFPGRPGVASGSPAGRQQ